MEVGSRLHLMCELQLVGVCLVLEANGSPSLGPQNSFFGGINGLPES
jgi:hypothetical protein